MITKEDYESWKDNPVTRQLFTDIEDAIIEAKASNRLGISIDAVALNNAHVQGNIDGLEELSDWYEMKLEEFNEDKP